MNRGIPVLTLIVGLTLGYVLGQKLGAGDDADLKPVRNEAGGDLVARSEFEAEIKKLQDDKALAERSTEAAFEREKEAKGEVERLQGEIARLSEELAAKSEVVAEAASDREERLKRIEDRFMELKDKGLRNLIGTNAIGKLIADLRQEGDLGREAVLALLGSEVAEERQLAATLLMQGMADAETLEPLKDVAMHDQDELTKRLASQALMRVEGDEVVGVLEDLVANADDEGVKVNSMYGLLMRGKGVEQAVAYYNDENNSAMMKQALGQSVFLLSNRPEVQPLIDTIVADARGKSREDGIVTAAIDYYAKVKTPAAIAALQKLAADPTLSDTLKAQAAAALN